jgi:hypothetical protein
MKTRPGQAILPCHQIFVERLVLVPQNDNSQLGHDSGSTYYIGDFSV